MRLAIGLGLAFGVFSSSAAEIAIDGPVMSHAVLQRNAPIMLSGEVGGNRVEVRFGDLSLEAKVADGRWSLTLPPMEAKDGSDLIIEGGGETIRFEDVAVGDVVLCSGQSNMVWPVSRSTGAPDAERMSDPSIRLLNIPNAFAPSPRRELPEGAAWVPASPEAVGAFSAVCWYTAERTKEQGVPLGLVSAAWGGSQIEAWVPTGKLAAVGAFRKELSLLSAYRDDQASAMRDFGELWEAWWVNAYDTRPWSRSHEDWAPVPGGEMRDWKDYGDPDTENHFGRVWFSKTIDLSTAEAEAAKSINIGLVDDIDATWVNGQFLGSTFSWSDERRYDIPGGLLTEGTNTITVNVLNGYGPGGLVGPNDAMRLVLEGRSSIPIDQGWRYKLVEKNMDGAPGIPWSSVTGYSTIHNGMIAPLGEFPMARAIWYQGESNTDHPQAYEPLLTGLVEGWRERFGQDLEVVVIQLPNFGGLRSAPASSGWAEVREAQRQVAIADPAVGLVVAIDAGDRTDIHPPNKAIIAERTARAFRALSKGEPGADGSGPTQASRRGRKIVVDLAPGDYTVIGNDTPIGIEVCGEGGACHWAEAALDDDRLVIEAPGRRAVAVRYCWADAPLCNLYTDNMLPVSPFAVDIEG